MMLRTGMARVRGLIDTDIDKGQFGTGTTAEVANNTALETPLSDTQNTATSTVYSQLLLEQVMANSVQGNGSTFSEFALQRSTAPITTISRSTFSGISKIDTREIRGITRYFVKSVEDY